MVLPASLACGIPIDLRDAGIGLDHRDIRRLVTVIRHTSGKRTESRGY